MPRTTLQDIIARIRLMIGDTGGTPVFSDDNLQSFLDENRVEFNYLILNGLVNLAAGASTYKVFVSEHCWEKSAKLFDLNHAEITPNNQSDFVIGRFVFDTNQSSQIYISGFAFDLNNTAADVCEAWAAKEKLNFDFAADSQNYQESQKFQMLKQMAADFRAKATFFGAGTADFGSGDWKV